MTDCWAIKGCAHPNGNAVLASLKKIVGEFKKTKERHNSYTYVPMATVTSDKQTSQGRDPRKELLFAIASRSKSDPGRSVTPQMPWIPQLSQPPLDPPPSVPAATLVTNETVLPPDAPLIGPDRVSPSPDDLEYDTDDGGYCPMMSLPED